ncbi:activating signal cointegrator 1 complex subunit 2 [Bacillus rossius redtenbacheri]|uniref:activating signal cointegrator 1 complex subunit 2 n=1 Tax=Bacillus rossius redtenbacheri TaxID=93214 RepID=UPI002FDDA757
MAFIDTENDQPSSNKPLDELEVEVAQDGAVVRVKALDPAWCEDRTYLPYAYPPGQAGDGGVDPGAKQDWLSTMGLYLEDLRWLLCLPQHRFWSNMVFKPECVETVLSFLQDAPPFYVLEEFPGDQDMRFLYQQVYHHVFLVVSRLATCRESQAEYMSLQTLGDLVYDNYLFTVPMMMDVCLLYGRTRRSQLHGIIGTVFSAQPNYQEDVRKSVGSVAKSMSYVEKQFAGAVSAEPVKLSSKGPRGDVSARELRDMVLHVLDLAATLSSFLDVCAPARRVFHQQMFCLRIVNLYENTLPEMYSRLEVLLNKEGAETLYADTRHKLDLARVELLAAFRHILAHPLHCALDAASKGGAATVKRHVDDYCSVLQECLSEKVFMRDYHSAHPVDVDLQLLASVSPDVEDKRHYLMESVLLSFDPPELKPPRPAPTALHLPALAENSDGFSAKHPAAKVTGDRLESLIAEVKDILPHLGDGFVQRCLEHYGHASEAVVNAVLEGALPPSLSSLDNAMPRIPPDLQLEVANGVVERSNVFDNDEFDIMTQDNVDTSRIHKGKRKSKHRDLSQMLNDKSALSEIRDRYIPLGYVDTDERLYDDEYDDTYDHLDVSIDEPGGEPDRRPLVVPRVLRPREEDSSGPEDRDDGDGEEEGGAPAERRDQFVENPEAVRARAEQQRQARFGRGRGRGQAAAPPPRDVVGGPKGQGQSKDVLHNRQKKTTNKSSRSNHNRKSGAQWKRSKAMVPS